LARCRGESGFRPQRQAFSDQRSAVSFKEKLSAISCQLKEIKVGGCSQVAALKRKLIKSAPQFFAES
jgi:hypothetical protein